MGATPHFVRGDRKGGHRATWGMGPLASARGDRKSGLRVIKNGSVRQKRERFKLTEKGGLRLIIKRCSGKQKRAQNASLICSNFGSRKIQNSIAYKA